MIKYMIIDDKCVVNCSTTNLKYITMRSQFIYVQSFHNIVDLVQVSKIYDNLHDNLCMIMYDTLLVIND